MISPLVLAVILLAVLLGSALSRRLPVPETVLLVAVGSLVSLLPRMGRVSLNPGAVLLIFLPALLYWESLTTSLREIWRLRRGVLLNGTLLVVVTAAAVASVLHLAGVPWGQAWVVGAALGPTDATAVAAVGKGIPRRQKVALQAESLINDGTALVVYALAIGMATGTVRPTALGVLGSFALSLGGGLGAGILVGWVLNRLRLRLHDPRLVNLVSVVTPFLAYVLAEEVHASGVVAVVAAGLYAARVAPSSLGALARLQAGAFWTLTTFLLNGALFVLVGLELPHSFANLSTVSVARAFGLVALAYAAMMVARYAFINAAIGVVRLLVRGPKQRLLRTTHRQRVVSTVAGLRGAVSLAVALSVPADLPQRDLVVFLVGTVVVVSLVAQGFSLPRVIRWAHLPEDRSLKNEVHLAHTAAVRAAYEALPGIGRDRGAPDDVVARLRDELGDKLAALEADEPDPAVLATRSSAREVRLDAVGVMRAEVVRLRDAGTIDDAALRQIQAFLDTEETRLRAMGR